MERQDCLCVCVCGVCVCVCVCVCVLVHPHRSWGMGDDIRFFFLGRGPSKGVKGITFGI
jgi:preprotein translocase subunit SecG